MKKFFEHVGACLIGWIVAFIVLGAFYAVFAFFSYLNQ